jgi:hypothetical protein
MRLGVISKAAKLSNLHRTHKGQRGKYLLVHRNFQLTLAAHA